MSIPGNSNKAISTDKETGQSADETPAAAPKKADIVDLNEAALDDVVGGRLEQHMCNADCSC